MPRGVVTDPVALRHLRHALRTPINHIIGYADLLLEEAEDQGGGRFLPDLRHVESAGRNLLSLVDEFLGPDRSESADVSFLSHRMRTPLNAVIGYAELVAEEAAETGAPGLLPDLQRIRTAAGHLMTLVNAALDETARAEEDAAVTESPAPGGTASVGARLTGSVLVVDDDAMNRDLLSRRLTRLGFSAKVAEDGAFALDVLRSQPFDLVLLDMVMPGLSGVDVLRILKADSQLRDVPVIVLSALDEVEDAARCIELGADDYVTKPFNPVLLLARIEACLERKHLRDREVEYLRRVAYVTGPATIAHLLHGVHGPTAPTAEAASPRVSLDDAERALLEDVEASADWVEVAKSEVLLQQGAASDSVYVLIYGRLQAVAEEGDARRPLGEVHPGETVGEWGLLSGRPRSATVVATRDSLLARISREVFERLADRHPRILTHATRDVVGRLRQAVNARWSGPAVTAFALVPLGPDVPLDDLARALGAELAEHGPTLQLDRRSLASVVGADAARALEEDETAERLVAWLDDLEAQHRFVLYQADAIPTTWTARCIRQADLILLVGRDGSDPRPSAMDAAVDRADGLARTPREVIVLHGEARPVARGTRAWLEGRPLRARHHVAPGSPSDVRALARRLAGRAVGLVLGGGGLRGVAHCGVLRALLETGIPVDLVGGTSAGALAAGQYAIGLRWDEIVAQTKEVVVARKALADYTLPLASMVAGHRFGVALRDVFGDTLIEDLTLPYFAVSSNLTRADIVVHDEGLLRRAIRASCSLPGVFLPVLQNGDLLVDGGILNNLPADVMASRVGNGTVIAVDLRVKVDLADEYRFDEALSGVQLLLNRLNPFASEKLRPPSMAGVLMRSSLLGSVHAGADQARQATFYLNPPVGRFPLLDGRHLDEVFELGYQTTFEAIEEWQKSGAFVGGARVFQRLEKDGAPVTGL